MREIRKWAVICPGLALSALLTSAGLFGAKEAKLDPKELVSRHVKSIGPPEKLMARKSCILEGESTWRMISGGSGSLTGPAVFISEGDKSRFNIRFNHPKYSAEQFVFDGEKVDVGFIQTGIRSRLGQFLYTYTQIVKEGLMGGVLSTRWALTELENRNPRLLYDGLKKIGGKEAHELRYIPRKGVGDLSVFLYFDPETYRHVATLYRLVIHAPIVEGRPELSASQKESHYELEEQFDNFREVEGLTLPTHWNIRFNVDTTGSSIAEWDVNYSKFNFNQPLALNAFTIQ